MSDKSLIASPISNFLPVETPIGLASKKNLETGPIGDFTGRNSDQGDVGIGLGGPKFNKLVSYTHLGDLDIVLCTRM